LYRFGYGWGVKGGFAPFTDNNDNLEAESFFSESFIYVCDEYDEWW